MRSVEWLAGILEGEGCFSDTNSGTSGMYRTPLISFAMTDCDVVEEVGKLFFFLGGRITNMRRNSVPNRKMVYILLITGLPAAKIMHSILPFMGERRSGKIRSILSAWNPKKYKEAVSFKTEVLGR